jgi:hypothetical protein
LVRTYLVLITLLVAAVVLHRKLAELQLLAVQAVTVAAVQERFLVAQLVVLEALQVLLVLLTQVVAVALTPTQFQALMAVLAS